MVRKGRSSILKRQRENEKRQRSAKKAEKAAEKRERRRLGKDEAPDVAIDSSEFTGLGFPDQPPRPPEP